MADKKRTRVERLNAAKADVDFRYGSMIIAAKYLDDLEAELARIAGPLESSINEATDTFMRAKNAFEVALNTLRLS